jgi:uncharacterized membrane protein YqaE (UPF0057 family)
MKKLVSIVIVSIILMTGSVYASFPVNNSGDVQQTEIKSNVKESKNVVDQKVINKSELKKALKEAKKSNSSKGGGVPIAVLYLLCFLFPVIAVGLATDWDLMPMIYNLLWTFLCGIPGIIHAIIVVKREA